MLDAKIVLPDQVAAAASQLRAEKRSIVFTNGVFDLLHPGHVRYLAAAAELGSQLIVGVNTDHSARRIKGEGRPLIPLEQRVEVLAAFEFVSIVTWFSEDSPEQLIRLVRPDVLVKGADWNLNAIAGKDFVESYGGRVQQIPYDQTYSTTKLVDKILKLPI